MVTGRHICFRKPPATSVALAPELISTFHIGLALFPVHRLARGRKLNRNDVQ